MKSSNKIWLWGTIAATGLSIGLLFQNCSPVQLNSGKIAKVGQSGTSSLSSLAQESNQNNGNSTQQAIIYGWATKVCAGTTCMAADVGVGDYTHISKPNKSCSASNVREVVTVRMNSGSNSVDHKVACYASSMSKQEILNLFEQNSSQTFTFTQGLSGTATGGTGAGVASFGPGPAPAAPAPAAPAATTPAPAATPSANGPSSATYSANVGDANSTAGTAATSVGSLGPVTLGDSATNNKCKMGEFATDNGGKTEWACDCAGDFSSWVPQGNGCYHRVKPNYISPMPHLVDPPVGSFGPGPAASPMPHLVEDPPAAQCKRGEFANGAGGQTMWACDCAGDFSSWVPQGHNCYHKNK